jgi:hypothetical protein
MMKTVVTADKVTDDAESLGLEMPLPTICVSSAGSGINANNGAGCDVGVFANLPVGLYAAISGMFF